METILKILHNVWVSLQGGQLPNMGNWNYLFLALLVAIEGPIATLLGAAAASAGFVKVHFVFIAAALGNLAADMGWYAIGYAGKVEWVLKIGKRLGLRSTHLAQLQTTLDQLQNGMKDHAPKLLIAAKLTAALTIPTLIAAGLARIPVKRFILGYAAAEALWTGALVVAGYYAAEAITGIERGLENLGIAGAAAFVVLVIVLFRRSFQQDNKGFAANLFKNNLDR